VKQSAFVLHVERHAPPAHEYGTQLVVVPSAFLIVKGSRQDEP